MPNDSFTFYCPTKIYFRENGLNTIGDIIAKDYGFKRVFLVYGGKHLKDSKQYDIICESLRKNQIHFIDYGGISANPDIEDVLKMVSMARAFQPELILGCGGGSVIDAAKSLANGYYYDGNPLDFNKRILKPLHALPIATILTIAASGSEMSDSCVISDRKHNFKNGFNSETNRPLFSLLDPTLTYSVSPYQTSMGIIDMFCHTFERYFSLSHQIEPCDEIALAVLKEIVETSKNVFDHLDDYETRRALMILSTVAHNGFTSYGKSFCFRIHQAEHKLSGAYPLLTHGQGIALLMVDFLKINKDKIQDKIIHFGSIVFNLKASDVDTVIETLRNWLNSFPIYHSFSELPFAVSDDLLEKAHELLKIK